MTIKAKDYIAKLTPAKQEVIRAHAEEMIAEEMNLAQLREALKRSQAELAEKCGVKQAAISRLERRADMRISTLRSLANAMGGTLCITVRFPNRRPVRISQFGVSDKPTAAQRSADWGKLEQEVFQAAWDAISRSRLEAEESDNPSSAESPGFLRYSKITDVFRARLQRLAASAFEAPESPTGKRTKKAKQSGY